MKSIFLSLASLLVATSALATVDGHTKVYLVVQDIQTQEFFIERAPILGCWGLAYGPELSQFTSEYNVPTNIGCGGESSNTENINYLTCAKVVEYKENANLSVITDLTLDISKCEAKADPKFITMVRTAAKLNFPQESKKKEVRLQLIK